MTDVTTAPESRAAFNELLDLLRTIDTDYLSPANHVLTPGHVAAGHRFMLHALGSGLDMFFEANAERPMFRRTLWAERKVFGDSPDTLYYITLIRPDRTYRIRGNIAGAVYTAFSVEAGGIDERFPPARVVASLNDGQFEVDADGNYEIIVSAEPHDGNWLRLEADAAAIATRHYFERPEPVANDPLLHIPLDIELLELMAPPPATTPATVARDIRRLANFLRGLTLDMMNNTGPKPSFMSTVPNQFNPPAGLQPGGYGAADIVNQMAPYALQPDQALVIEGRLPPCRFANFMLWNRFLQTYDYANHSVSLNRRQLHFEDDGSFRIVIAHSDPGCVNWLDTCGEPYGLIYVRCILPEQQPTQLTTRLVTLNELRRE
jgi:hypothetical protein